MTLDDYFRDQISRGQPVRGEGMEQNETRKPVSPHAAVMRAEQLQQIATRLANQCFVRYWLHWNYPYEPHYMAIECRDFRMQPMQVSDMGKYGFEWDEVDRRYYIERDLVADGLKSA